MPSRSTHARRTLVALSLACATALAACATDTATSDDVVDQTAASPTLPGTTPSATSSTAPDASDAADDLPSVALEIAGHARSVTVVTGETDGAFFRAAGSSVEATTTEAGPGSYTLDVTVADGTPDRDVTVHLDPAVMWDLTFTGGAETITADLSQTQVSAVDVTTGARTIDVTLPEPTGTVPVNHSGGASQLALHLPEGIPATVSLAHGIGSATLDGVTLDHATRSTSLGDDAAADRYAVAISGGLGSFTLDRS